MWPEPIGKARFVFFGRHGVVNGTTLPAENGGGPLFLIFGTALPAENGGSPFF